MDFSLFPSLSLPRAGLLATQGIRGGDNRTVLQRIKSSGDIFMAWSDKEWVLDGAMVHVSIIGFDNGANAARVLDGALVSQINPDLSADIDVTTARPLPENLNIAFMGDTKGGPFELEYAQARKLLGKPNPNNKPNTDVLRPWINGSDLAQRNRGMWIIDFGCDMPHSEAALFAEAFRHVEVHVKPDRVRNRRAAYAQKWWIHVEPRPALREHTEHLERFLVTTRVAKHRLFEWFKNPVLVDSATFAFARTDDYFFGMLHSSVHEIWSRRTATQLREEESGTRYTPSTCFETFPFPWPPGREETKHPVYARIADAAKELAEYRHTDLNPPTGLAPLAQIIDAQDKFLDVPPEARPLIRHSALMAAAAQSPNLKKRTLTNLYNERPTWLKLAHEKLDKAVLAAYAHIDPEGHWSESWATLYTETGAGTPLPPNHPQHERLATDQKILTNLLRLNHQRANEST